MSCKHRFLNDLKVKYPIKHLFVGTFNPAWNNPNGDNAKWFYGRKNNDFWYILPQVFGDQSLLKYKENKEYLSNWCFQNQVGITDLIYEIKDVSKRNKSDTEKILKFSDDYLDSFNEITFNNIKEIIHTNKSTLKGVYLTRYDSTFKKNSSILNIWEEIIIECDRLNIYNCALITPSRNYRKITRDQKMLLWKTKIKILD